MQFIRHPRNKIKDTPVDNIVGGNIFDHATILSPYTSIQNRLQLEDDLPYTENWSAAADFLHHLIDDCLENKPAQILECSSGLSTLVLARCCQINQCGQVFSLENGQEYAEKTRSQLLALGLNEYATVVHAPLQSYSLGGKNFDWYALEQLPTEPIELLVIDGPPGFIQHHSRYPALPLLRHLLADNCRIYLDDAGRDEEKEIVALWMKTFPGIQHKFFSTERGCSLLYSETVGKDAL